MLLSKQPLETGSRKHKISSNNYNKIIKSSTYVMDNYGTETWGEGKEQEEVKMSIGWGKK